MYQLCSWLGHNACVGGRLNLLDPTVFVFLCVAGINAIIGVALLWSLRK